MPRRAWACAELDSLARPGRPDDTHAEARDLLTDLHLVDDLLRDEEGSLAKERGDVAAMRQVERAQLSVLVAVLELELDQEAVELRLRDREDALVLVRVLGRHDEERRVDEVRAAAERYVALLHRLEQAGLYAGRGAVDLVGEEDVGEDRAALEHELATPCLHRPDQLVRRRVRGELDALEVRAEHPSHGLCEQRLRRAGRAFEQHVTAREGRDQHQVDSLVVTDDGFRDLESRTSEQLAQPLGRILLANEIPRFSDHVCHSSISLAEEEAQDAAEGEERPEGQ